MPRSAEGALLHDPAEVTERVLRLVSDGVVAAVDGSDVAVTAESACVHGDSPGAVEMARAVRAGLEKAGIALAGVRMKVLPLRRRRAARRGRRARRGARAGRGGAGRAADRGARRRAGRPDGAGHGGAGHGPRRPAAGRPGPARRPGDRRREGETVEIPVTYDGPDLAEVARLTGLDEDEVVAAHTGTPWRIAFGGFAPGFAYLTGRRRAAAGAAPRRAAHDGAGRRGRAGRASSAASTRARRRVGGSSSARPTPRCGTPTATRPLCFFRAARCGSGRRHDRRREVAGHFAGPTGSSQRRLPLRSRDGLCEVGAGRSGEARPRGGRGRRDRPRAGPRTAGARGVGGRTVRGGGPSVVDAGEPAGRQRGGRRGRRGGPRRARRPGDLAADGRPGRGGGPGVGGRHAGRPPRRRRPAARAGAAARDAADRPAHLPRGARGDRRRAGTGVAQHGHAVRARAASVTDRGRSSRRAGAHRAAARRRRPGVPAAGRHGRAARRPRPARRVRRRSGGADRDRLDRVEPQRPDRHAAGGRAAAAGRRRRGAQRGDGPRRDPGAAGRGTGRVPRRSPRDRRLPGRRDRRATPMSTVRRR